MTPISLLGAGFIGGRYAQLYPQDTIIEPRECIAPLHPDVLFTRSTTSNYNVLKPETLKLDVETNLSHLLDVLPNVRGCFNWTSTWFVSGANDWGHHPAWRAKETHLCNPNGLYSISKLAAEQTIRSYVETVAAMGGAVAGPSSYRILRLSNVIGNDPRAGRQKNALEYLLSKVIAHEDVPLYEGNNWRDTLHVDDTCRAIRLCMERGEPHAIYNVGRGESHKLEDIIQYAIEQTGSRSRIVRVPVPAFHKVVQVPDYFMCTAKLRGLGFEPQMSIWQSVDRVLAGLTSAPAS